MKGQFLSPGGFVERLRKAFPVERKAEIPGRKGDSSPERGRKGLAGGVMKETDARSKVPKVDGIFFKSLKGFSRGSSSGQIGSLREPVRKRALTWSWEQRLSNSTWEAQVQQKPCGKLPKGEPESGVEAGGRLGSTAML
uniref:Uncharacterized protein n=1 Tax=Myotis myotis TaxID=51298 RepID=A0A7J7U5A2_MYOMY|nr:hypothetical protein mMyoMyo1_008842 [Myotis myotis]